MDFTFSIEKKLGILKEGSKDGWSREVNLVSWNGQQPPKIDIREWSPDHTKMSRGITLSETEAERLIQAIAEHLEGRA